MENSILFSSKDIEDLNDYIRDKIHDNLYLFAYYNPKKYTIESNDSSTELNFIKAVLNLYSLYKDCGIFVFQGTKDDNDLVKILEIHGYINNNDKKRISTFMNIVNSFRMLFAHNVYKDSSSDVQYMKTVQKFISQVAGDCDELFGYNQIKLSSNDWNKLLVELKNLAEEVIKIFKGAFEQITMSTDAKIVIDEWRQLIIETYKKQIKKYLFTVMKNDLKIYVFINKYSSFRDYSKVIHQYYQQIEGSCITMLEDVSVSYVCQMTPFEFYNELLKKVNITECWKEYFSIS